MISIDFRLTPSLVAKNADDRTYILVEAPFTYTDAEGRSSVRRRLQSYIAESA